MEERERENKKQNEKADQTAAYDIQGFILVGVRAPVCVCVWGGGGGGGRVVF